MVTESEVEKLEKEVEQKREELEEQKQKERLEDAESELRDIRDSAEDILEDIEEREKRKEQDKAVENDDAFYCGKCDKFVEYPTDSLGRKKPETFHENRLCASCNRKMLRRKHNIEIQEILGDNPVIIDYTVNKWQNRKVRESSGGAIGSIETELTIEAEDGVEYDLVRNFDHDYYYIKEVDDD